MTSSNKFLPMVLAALFAWAVCGPSALSADRLGVCKDLYVVEFTPGHETGNEQNLIRYRFCEGELSLVDTVFTTQTDDVRFDIFKNRIHNDRYLINGSAEVIDLKTGSVLHRPERSRYLSVENNRVIWQTSEAIYDADSVPIGSEQFVWYYDLETGSSGDVPRPSKWHLPGALSPDGTRSVENQLFDGMMLHHLDGTTVSLGTGFSVSLSPLSSSWSRVPVLWIDNDRILTQTENGHLAILHPDGRVEPLLEVDIGTELILNPSIHRDARDRIIYEDYIIDVDNRKAVRTTRKALGHGFEIEYGFNKRDSAKVWCDDIPIATFVGGGGKATDDYLCVTVCEFSKNHIRRPTGISVWSRETEEWTALDVAWIAGVIGWANPIE